MVQTVFLLEKMLLEQGKAAKMAFAERFAEQSFTLALQAYVGPSGPWTLQGVHTQTPLYNPGAFMLLGPAGPWALQGPIPKQRPEAPSA